MNVDTYKDIAEGGHPTQPSFSAVEHQMLEHLLVDEESLVTCYQAR